MVTNKAKFNKENQVVLEVNKPKFLIKHKSDRELRDELFNKIDRDSGTYKWKIPTFKDRDNKQTFKRFCYFNPEHLFERESPFISEDVKDKRMNFLLAYDSQNQNPEDIIGVLKFGIYNSFNSLPDYWAINYVDVREDQRQRGVCTSLFHRLNEVLTPEDWLCGTYLDPMGELCRLDKKLHEIITVCPYFDDKYAFYDYCKENRLLVEMEED